MIWVVGGDRLRAPELLGEHDAGEEMRPGLRAERQRGARAREDRRIEPLCAADDEGEAAARAPGGKAAREAGGVEALAAAIEGDQKGTGGDRGKNRLGLAAAALRLRAARLRQFDEREPGAQAAGVLRVERGFRSGAGAADGDEQLSQRNPAPGPVPGPTCAPARRGCVPPA